MAVRRPPDAQLMDEAGFVGLGRSRFSLEHRWTLPELVEFVHSTSLLPTSVLGDQAALFAADLTDRLLPYVRDGALEQEISFAYELFRWP